MRVPSLLAGRPDDGNVDAHGIQAFYTGLVARAAENMDVNVDVVATISCASALCRCRTSPGAIGLEHNRAEAIPARADENMLKELNLREFLSIG